MQILTIRFTFVDDGALQYSTKRIANDLRFAQDSIPKLWLFALTIPTLRTLAKLQHEHFLPFSRTSPTPFFHHEV
jgi:hypothetical protein